MMSPSELYERPAERQDTLGVSTGKYMYCSTLAPKAEATSSTRKHSSSQNTGSAVDQVPPLPSTLAITVMVFQLRVVTGTPKSRSNVPR